MKTINQSVRVVACYFRALCLESTLATLMISLYSCRLLNSTTPTFYSITLALAVWSIYMVDHVLDVWRTELLIAPHRKLLKERLLPNVLIGVGLAGTISLATALSYFSKRQISFTLLPALLSLFYLLLLNSGSALRAIKELVLSLIFMLGVILIPVLEAQQLCLVNITGLFMLYLCILLNIITCAALDQSEDHLENFFTLTTTSVTPRNLLKAQISAALIIIIIGIWLSPLLLPLALPPLGCAIAIYTASAVPNWRVCIRLLPDLSFISLGLSFFL